MGITLTAARINKGYTQEQVAEKLGINPITLAKYEKRPELAPFGSIVFLCSLYGLGLEAEEGRYIFLLNGSDK